MIRSSKIQILVVEDLQIYFETGPLQYLRDVDAKEHHTDTEAVWSQNKLVDQQPWRPMTGTAAGSWIAVLSFLI